MRRTRITGVELRKVTQKFGSEAPLFGGVDLKLPLGEILAVEGGPGTGKSMLLKIMAGLVEPSAGSVLYNGLDLSDLSFEEFAPLRLSTSFSFDDGGLLMNKTLEENLKIGLVYHRGWRHERSQNLFEELVGDFEMRPYLHLRPAQVSSSLRKIAGLVRVFLHNAQILFLDDPSLGIGEKAALTLNLWLRKFRKEGKHDELIVVASSDAAFIKELDCTHLKIQDGGLVLTRRMGKGAA